MYVLKYTYVNQNHHYCVRCTETKTVYKNQHQKYSSVIRPIVISE